MNTPITATAPGKVILFGEHAVVYGRPALAVPVTQLQAQAIIYRNSRHGIHIEAPDIELFADLGDLPAEHPLAFTVSHLLTHLNIAHPPNCIIYVQSTIPVASGLGSGAAVSVAIMRALSKYLGQSLTNEKVNDLAFEVEVLHHGTPSGIDNTVVTYAKPVFFVKGQPVSTFHPGAAFTLVLGDTGIPAPTRESVQAVKELWMANKPRLEDLFDRIGELARAARTAIERGDLPALGSLMDTNHTLLQALTVSCPELDRLVDAARAHGALGAKLSGGGRGGNMIALVKKENAPAVAEALISAGARRTTITEVK